MNNDGERGVRAANAIMHWIKSAQKWIRSQRSIPWALGIAAGVVGLIFTRPNERFEAAILLFAFVTLFSHRRIFGENLIDLVKLAKSFWKNIPEGLGGLYGFLAFVAATAGTTGLAIVAFAWIVDHSFLRHNVPQFFVQIGLWGTLGLAAFAAFKSHAFRIGMGSFVIGGLLLGGLYKEYSQSSWEINQETQQTLNMKADDNRYRLSPERYMEIKSALVRMIDSKDAEIDHYVNLAGEYDAKQDTRLSIFETKNDSEKRVWMQDVIVRPKRIYRIISSDIDKLNSPFFLKIKSKSGNYEGFLFKSAYPATRAVNGKRIERVAIAIERLNSGPRWEAAVESLQLLADGKKLIEELPWWSHNEDIAVYEVTDFVYPTNLGATKFVIGIHENHILSGLPLLDEIRTDLISKGAAFFDEQSRLLVDMKNN